MRHIGINGHNMSRHKNETDLDQQRDALRPAKPCAHICGASTQAGVYKGCFTKAQCQICISIPWREGGGVEADASQDRTSVVSVLQLTAPD